MRKSILSYNEYSNMEQTLTYEMWCGLLDSMETGTLSEGLKDILAKAGTTAKDAILRIFGPIKGELIQISEKFKINLSDIIKALKQRTIFGFFKAIGFKIRLLINMMTELAKLVRNGLVRVFTEIHRNKYIQKIRSGAMKIDEILDKYPLLKRISGIAIAGILFYIWLNMSFIGDLEYDMNISSITGALVGSFSLADLFVSPEGLLMVSLFATGGIISFPWLSANIFNILLATIYTGYVKLQEKSPQTIKKIKSYIKIK